ncbi:MFS general substrate transporter [Annulohypoxylon maeteangense]|uniref:MFS general substrate transporter n=1 Tax=Annulohypoxylon maeteangense TaxID=1927788 RepID=UPI002007DD12|nr:MFS general substrate transporter [Annulohypoxylon maeteangense]KAI0879968.1 MFS general substrate transporter [Annulohypoxylon maeteangense]
MESIGDPVHSNLDLTERGGEESRDPRAPSGNHHEKDESSHGFDSNRVYDPDQNTKPEDTERTIRGLKWFFAYSSLLSTVLFYALDGTIVADIQPSIIDTFGDTGKLSWIGVGMFLGAISILPIGRAYGIFNVKWLFLSLVTLFEVGSAVCGAAPSMDAFIVGRVIQGVGACGCYSGAITYISMTTTQRERPLYLSGIVATWSIGSVLGPVIGGAFAQSSATWRWAFYINLIVAAVTAPSLILCLPNIDPAAHLTFKEKLRTQDWASICIFLAGSACLTMGLTFGGTLYAFDSGSEIALWTVSGVLLIAFVLITVYHPKIPIENRLYPIHLMKNWELNILQFAIFVAAGSMVTTLYYTPLLFQFTRNDGALMAGVRLLPFLGGMVFFSVLNGALMPKLGYYMPWYVLGTALILVGSTLMYTVNVSTSEAHIYGYTVLLGGGCGSFFTAGFSVVQIMVPVSELSNAISFMAIGQQMGQIIVLSLAGSVFQNIGTKKIAAVLPNASAHDVSQLTLGTHSAIFESLSPDLQASVIEQITLALRNVFIIMVAVSALGLISSLFLKRRKIY